jgi:L-lactate dehydrogenase complex protein LldG
MYLYTCMIVSKSKENVLKKIRAALVETTPVPFIHSEGNSNLFEAPHDDVAVIFAEEFSKLDGKFIYIENEQQLAATVNKIMVTAQLQKLYCAETSIQKTLEQGGFKENFYKNLASCEVGITYCESLVARTGTIVLSSASEEGRTASVYCPVHICIAYAGQMVYDVKDALLLIKEKYKNNIPSLISFATGPSRSADIEKTLVKGIHGPKEVFCILIEN